MQSNRSEQSTAERHSDILFELSKSAYIDSGYFEIAAETLAEAATRGLATSRASVWLTEDDGNTLYCAALTDDGERMTTDGLALTRALYPGYFEAMMANRLVAAEDVYSHPATAAFSASNLRAKGVCAMLDVPFRFNGRVAGVICCEDRNPRTWSDEDQHFVTALTEMAARALAAKERQHAQDALNAARTGIESVVAERTMALRQALGQLQEAQSQLIQVEKMAALGALVAGVAHEINTPLGIGVTAASHLKESLREMQDAFEQGRLTRDAFDESLKNARDGADILLRNLERAAHLVQSFKRVAVNQSDEAVTRFDLRGALRDLLHSMSPECRRYGVTIDVDFPAGVMVNTFAYALDQVITNLVVNALRHAFPSGKGHIRITGSVQHAQVLLRVSDDGVGIEPTILPNIFDPFVTTKRDQGGTGLGLHIVLNLIHYRLKGRIGVSSDPGKGCVFEIMMPIDVELVAALPMRAAAGPAQSIGIVPFERRAAH